MTAAAFPDLSGFEARVAIVDGDNQYRFADLSRLTARVANALQDMDLAPGSRVAALLPNGVAAAAAFLAIAGTGHSYLPLNIGLRARELQATFRRCGVRAAACLREAADALGEGVAPLPVEALLDQPVDAEDGRHDAMRPLGRDPDSEFVCLTTSGSSGEPRLIARSTRAVRANTRQVAAALEVTADDRFLAVVPFWHANGFSNCLLTPLSCGARVVTMSRFLPRLALETIAKQRITVVIGSPFIFKAFAQVLGAGAGRPDLGSVRAWISSGAALPPDLDASLRELGLPVRQLYGSSETGTLCLSGAGPLEPGCVGSPLPGVEIRLVDESGAATAPGEPGEVEVRSAALFDGYVEDRSERPARDAGGYYRMGDLGRWNAAGELVLLGRSDAMINLSGVKVDPREVQAVLESMPGITSALIYGRADTGGLLQLRALIVAQCEISPEEVLAYCRGRLAEYKLPRALEFVDSIPQDLMGKTSRRLLET